MRTLRIGRIVVAALLLSGCGPKLPTLTERGDEAARTAIRQANERIGAANSAMKSRKPGKETKAFVEAVGKRLEAFDKDSAAPDVALVATLGHAAGVVSQAVGGGPDRPLDAALGYFAKRAGEQPAQWSGEVEQLARVLELEGADLSRVVAGELRALRAQLESDVAAIEVGAGPQRRCRAGGAEQPVDEAAGRLVASALSSVHPSADAGWTASLQQPALCTTDPAQLVLSRAQATGPLVSTTATLAVYGLNLKAAPAASIRDAAGQTVPVSLAPAVKTTSRADVPLQGLDLSPVPAAGARIVVALQGGAPSELSVPLVAGVKADFDAIPRDGTAPLQVMFSDRSAGNPTGWRWTFGDGTGATEQHPKHLFARPGSYAVQLAVTRPDSTDTAAKPAFVTVRAPPLQTKIVPPAVPGPAPVAVVFRHESSRPVTSVCWTFGDGVATACQPQVSHTYQAAGTFTATLKVKDEFGTEATANAQVVVAAPPLVAAFNLAPATGVCPLTVQFANTSQHPNAGTSWLWTFSEGPNATTHDAPAHVYRRPGSYGITVTASYQSRQSTATRTVSVASSRVTSTTTVSRAATPLPRDFDVVVPSAAGCGAGFRRESCTARKGDAFPDTITRCETRWVNANDVHDCRCNVHIHVGLPGGNVVCNVTSTKIREGCTE